MIKDTIYHLQKLLIIVVCFFSISKLQAQDTLTFGSTANFGALPLIAKNENFFTQNDLTVEYKKLQTGKITMDALISGDIEVGTIVDSNVSFLNFTKNQVKVIASISKKYDDAIYFIKGSSIASPRDLVGKRIGFAPATTSHIFLVRFLERNKIDWNEIKPIILQPPAMEAALRNGAVDAISIWQPWGVNIQSSFTKELSFFSNSADLYPSQILLATTDQVIQKKPEALKKLLKSLKQALVVLDKNPSQTYPYLSQELVTTTANLEIMLKSYEFKLEPGSTALKLVKEIGQWISQSQENFKGQPLPSYESAFSDNLL